MTSLNQNDTFYANNKRVLKFTLTNEDESPAIALDCTDLTVRWAMSKFSSTGQYLTTPILEKTEADGITFESDDPTLGVVLVTIDPVDTAALSGKFYHELEVIDGSGNPVIVATGTLIIKKNVENT